MSNVALASRFLLQLGCLIAACRIVGLIARRFGQPQVVAEMITGILLGPSFFGLLAPALQTALFPKESMTVIYVIAQIGLVLYMFQVGVDFQWAHVTARLRTAATISIVGIIVPFALGAALSTYLVSNGPFFGAEVRPHEAALYLGAAMSITAFPVLARIIHDRGIAGTMLGTLTLAAGATDDAVAWCLLAFVLASVNADSTVAILAVAGGVTYAVLMLTVGCRWLVRLGDRVERAGSLDGPTLAIVLIALCFSAWTTDAIGIHSVFGAFMLGAAMPRGRFAREIHRQLEPLTTNFLVPLFFVYSGLNTQMNLMSTTTLLGLAVLVMVLSTVGKGVACWVAARISGLGPRDALAVGVLMNTRGLMELIILNVGRERGIIDGTLFAIMVLMAIVTTVAAGPIFELVYRPQPVSAEKQSVASTISPVQS